MHSANLLWLAPWLVLAGVGGASAQAPVLKHESAFNGYRPYADEPRAVWREVNDTVQGVGGHAEHVRPGPDAQPAPASDAAVRMPEAASPSRPVAPAKPANPHAGHGGRK